MKNVIIDSDVMNEIDDQFAIAYALCAKELNVQAITICPFNINYKRISIKDGLVDSYFEAKRLCRLAGKNPNIVYKGSTGYVTSGYKELTEGTKKIIEIALKNRKTYVVCLGTLTNVAIALLNEPKIAKKIEVIWLGTKNLLADKFNDSNYIKDKKAFEVVVKSDVKLHIIPSYVGKFNGTSVYEIKEHVAINPLGKHLYSLVENFDLIIVNRGLKYIYDIMPIAYLINKKLFEYKDIDRNLVLKEETKLQDKKLLTYVYDGSSRHSVWKEFLNTISEAPTNIFKSKIFFTSDTHFSQKDKVRSKEFKLSSTEKTDHEYIKRWNSVVGEDDTVYHLGDFGNYNIIKKLNGQIILICGNYERDDIKLKYNNDFEKFKKYLLSLGFKDVVKDGLILDKNILGKEVYLTHKPTDTKKDMFNLFGHVHSLKPIMPNGFNVCIEYHDFKPIGVDIVKDYMKFILTRSDEDVFVD